MSGGNELSNIIDKGISHIERRVKKKELIANFGKEVGTKLS